MELSIKSEFPDEDLEEATETASCSKIQKALNTMLLTAVTTSQGERFIKVKSEPLGAKIFRRLKMNMPGNISTKNELLDCFALDAAPLPVQMSFL